MADLTHSDNFEGLELKDVIPQGRKPWYKDRTLIKLNTLMLCAAYHPDSVWVRQQYA